MKKIFKKLAIFTLINIASFICISFNSLELNPLNWSELARFLFSLFFGCSIFIIISDYID